MPQDAEQGTAEQPLLGQGESLRDSQASAQSVQGKRVDIHKKPVQGNGGKLQIHISIDGTRANIVGTEEECAAFPAWFNRFYAAEHVHKLETATNVVRDFETDHLQLTKKRRRPRTGPLA